MERIRGRHASRLGAACIAVGFVLWLLSYAWIPLGLLGWQPPRGFEWEDGRNILLALEIGALTAGVTAALLGVKLERGATDAAARRLGRRHVTLGVTIVLLVIVPNILGSLLQSP